MPSRADRPEICRLIRRLIANIESRAHPENQADAYELLELMRSEDSIRASEYSLEERVALVKLWDLCNGRLPWLEINKRDETLVDLESMLRRLEPSEPSKTEVGATERNRAETNCRKQA